MKFTWRIRKLGRARWSRKLEIKSENGPSQGRINLVLKVLLLILGLDICERGKKMTKKTIQSDGFDKR